MNLSDKKALVMDCGLFTEMAVRLARDFGEVFYWTDWRDAFPEPFQSVIGRGLEGVERVKFWEEYVDKVDLIFIPDTMFSETTEFLKRHGYPVAGAGRAEKLELDRWYGRQIQKYGREVGEGEGEPSVINLPTQETIKVTGTTNMEKFLRENKDYFVKINMFRGLEESFHHVDWKQSEETFYHIAYRLGPFKEEVVFICEEKLPGCEPGLDGITWEGELMYPTMGGYEEKGVGIIERVYESEKALPRPLLWLAEGFSSEFIRHKTRFFWSIECKVDHDMMPYAIDPTIRLAAPGTSAIQCEIITNYSEVVMGLATGERVNPIYSHKYGAALSMDSPEANDGWHNVNFPKEMRQWVKLRMAVKCNEDYYCVPGFDGVGCVIGLGDTIEEAVGLVKERVKSVEGKRLNKDPDKLDDIMKNIEEGKKCGIDF